jgi:uncharacterized membrane protein YeaQ/YmgE (transglycosylase-associated protein family)
VFMIGFLVFGLFVGLIARLLLPGRQHIGLLWTLALGVVGSVIGGTIANALGTGDIWELNFVGAIAAIGTSMVVLAIAERSGLGQGGDRRDLTGPGRA